MEIDQKLIIQQLTEKHSITDQTGLDSALITEINDVNQLEDGLAHLTKGEVATYYTNSEDKGLAIDNLKIISLINDTMKHCPNNHIFLSSKAQDYIEGLTAATAPDVSTVATNPKPARSLPDSSTQVQRTSVLRPAKPATQQADSSSAAPVTVASCLLQIENEFAPGQEVTWVFPQPKGAFATHYHHLRDVAKNPPIPIKTKAGLGSAGATSVNKFLKDNGFQIQLNTNHIMPTDIFAASVMDIQIEWDSSLNAKPTTIQLKDANNTSVPGVQMRSGTSLYAFAIPDDTGTIRHVAVLPTNNPEVIVAMMPYDTATPQDSASLYEITRRYTVKAGEDNFMSITGLDFPMVNYDRSGTIEDVIGSTGTAPKHPGEVQVIQAMYQHKLRVNETGARAQAAAAMQARTKGISFHNNEVILTIDGPFLVWFVVKDENGKFNEVFFAAHIMPEHMKNPGSLD